MASKNSYTGINPKIVTNIRYYAKLLKKDQSFSHEDIEDVEQDLLLDCWPILAKYNEFEEQYDAFVTQLIKSRARNLREKQLCKKRAIDFVDEIDDELCKEGGESFEYDSAVRIDVNETIAKLPSKLKKICKLLMKYNEVSEISKQTGIPQQTIYSAIKRLRKDKKFADLKAHLSKQEL